MKINRLIIILLLICGSAIILFCFFKDSREQLVVPLSSYKNQQIVSAVDSRGNCVDLPFSIRIDSIKIKEYPPRVVLKEKQNGNIRSGDSSVIWLSKGVFREQIGDWIITFESFYEKAIPVDMGNWYIFKEVDSIGATYASHVNVRNAKTFTERMGWISCGSSIFSPYYIDLDDQLELVMLNPGSYAAISEMTIISGEIETRKKVTPKSIFKVDGWTIYPPTLNYILQLVESEEDSPILIIEKRSTLL